MSQSCDAIQLVVIDVDAVQPDMVTQLVADVVRAGMRLGAVSSLDDLGHRLSNSPQAAYFDFWLPGANSAYPFDRLMALIDTAPGHILLVTSNDDAITQSHALGVRSLDPENDDITRILT